MYTRLINMWELNNNIILIKGIKCSAIYDFNTGNVYSVNDIATDIIQRIIINNAQPRTQIEKDYYQQLVDSHLVSSHFCVKEFTPPPAPQISLNFAWVELTTACNLRCVHCYEGNEHHCINNELKYDDWIRVLHQLKAVNCKSIQFIGGEPCLNRDLENLIKVAVDLGFEKITIFSNATIISDSLIDLCAQKHINFRFSLYGGKAEIHDSVTNIPGSFNKTILNVKKLIDKGVVVSPAVVILKQNENHLAGIENLITSLGLKCNQFDIIRNVYGGTQTNYTPQNTTLIHTTYRTKPYFKTSQSKFLNAYYNNTCWFGKIAITPTGKVIPCVFERSIELGDVTTHSIADILSSESLKKHWSIDFSQVETCKDCEYRFACKDCRPLGRSVCGNLYGKNPRCLYNPYTGSWEN